MRSVSGFLLAALLGLSRCADASNAPGVVSAQFDICSHARAATFALREGLDAEAGQVVLGTESASIYVGRHPPRHGYRLADPAGSHGALRERAEIRDTDRYVLLYSYVGKVAGFDHAVFDEVFVAIEGTADSRSVAFVRKLGQSLFRCHEC